MDNIILIGMPAVVKEAVSTQDKAKIQAAISEASSMESSSEQ